MVTERKKSLENTLLSNFCFLSPFSFFSNLLPSVYHLPCVYKCSLPQKVERPLCSSSLNTSTEQQYSFENQSYGSSEHQHVIDSHLSYELEDDIIHSMDDDESNHSYVFLQQQQHYTPPPVEFQEGSTPQHQSLIKKGSIMRNNPELMKRNRQNNS